MTLLRRFELPLVLLLLTVGAAFLLKMCYLSLAINCIFGLVFLTVFYIYVRARHALMIPATFLVLVFAALQVDALGNYFHMYGRKFGPMQYDEFSHMAVQVLITPIIIWLVRRALERLGHNVSLGVAALFAITMMFSIAACYEIIELWDEVYFGGQRIWSKYDTANDLQWDLCGILIGTVLALPLLRFAKSKSLLRLSTQNTQTSSS
ncbi:MAG TPA: hypothetical protein VLA93_21770 [Pyrinomonadaceae bacterium]|nr:hypothetical protein [Pyrinomonadaceae bacterium]